MSEITTLNSSVQVKQKLPNSDKMVLLDMIGGWEECTEKQRAYLSTYFQTYPKKMMACMESGVSESLYRKWKENDPVFVGIMNTIEQIHLEELKSREYTDAYVDKTVRGRVIDNIENKTKKKQGTKGDTYILNMNEYLSNGLDKDKEVQQD